MFDRPSPSGTSQRGASTLAVHGVPHALTGLTTPIELSTAFAEGSPGGYVYSRIANPTLEAVARRIAALEGVDAAVLTSSGTAALLAAVLVTVPMGARLAASTALCEDTETLLSQTLPDLGRRIIRIEPRDTGGWRRAFEGGAVAALTEVVSNPGLVVTDLDRLSALAAEHGALVLVDSTLVTPINCRPAEHGADLTIHSATKALNGHSDVTAGVVAGSRELIERVRDEVLRHGGNLDPHAAFLLERGLKTLALRVGCQNASALEIASWLDARSDVLDTRYPLLPGHPDLAAARTLLHGGGCVVTMRLSGGRARGERFLDDLRLVRRAPTLGGVETLATLPSMWDGGDMIRLSIGIEDVGDLRDDIGGALAASVAPAERAISDSLLT